MAHHVEPMDIDSDFDNKENSLRHNNVLPFTEKGYEELDVSELNMKLRYSITPASSPMSKSYTANCIDNRSQEPGDDSLNVTINENVNLTQSLNSNIRKGDSLVKSMKTLPLQCLPTDQFADKNRSSGLRQLDSTVTQENANVTVTICEPNDIDENISLPSCSSSVVQTPEATTPTKDVHKNDGGSSPIMRGLKTVLNMFRSSQSPIPPADSDEKPSILSPAEGSGKPDDSKPMLISTPIASHRKKEMSPTKRSSPQKDSIVFNEDLETELQWKDETTVLFSQERIPIHKLFPTHPVVLNKKSDNVDLQKPEENLDSTVEYMDISYNDSIGDRTMTNVITASNNTTLACESDGEFVDCETTFTKHDSVAADDDKTPVSNNLDLDSTVSIENVNLDSTLGTENVKENSSTSRLKQIVLNTTQDILDATLSITPEDLMPSALDKTRNLPSNYCENVDQIHNLVNVLNKTNNILETDKCLLHENPVNNQTLDIIQPFEANNPNVTQNIVHNNELLLDQTLNMSINEINENAVGNQVSASNKNETIVIENNLNKDAETILTTDNTSILRPSDDISTDIAKIDLIASQTQQTISSDIAYNYNEVIPIPLDHGAINETSPVKDISMIELAVDVPLPDEDDLDKELDDLVNEDEHSTAPNSLRLDLLDDILVKHEPSELIHNAQEIKLEGGNSHDVLVPTELLPSLSIPINSQTGIEKTQDLPDKQELHLDEKEILPEDGTENKIELIKMELNNEISEQKNIQNNMEMSENNNPSIIESKCLPDIINESSTCASVGNVSNEQIISEPAPEIKESVSENNKKEPTSTEISISDQLVTELVPHEKVSEDSVPIVAPFLETKSELKIDCINIVQEEINNTNEVNKIEEIISENNVAVSIPQCTDVKKEAIVMETNNLADIIPSGTEISNKDHGNIKSVDEEVIVSESNSPFVSVTAENISEQLPNSDEQHVPNLEDASKTDEVSHCPPSSPPIASKGYNFNFDEIDDPFATKTKIRLSPPLETPNKTKAVCETSKSCEMPIQKKEFQSRRKSQSERKKPCTPKRKLNTTFDGESDKIIDKSSRNVDEDLAVSDIKIELPPNETLHSENIIAENNLNLEANLANDGTVDLSESSKTQPVTKQEDKLEELIETPHSEIIISHSSEDVKTTSSSDHSTIYYSAGTSSSESIPSKNVFNLPEIDDIHFNPFASKSKIRQSPPPNLDVDNPFATPCKMRSSFGPSEIVPQIEDNFKVDNTNTISSQDKIETELMEKNTLENLSNTSNSSKATDERNETIKEINTEDEDTIEGPFLETEELNTDDKMTDLDDDNVDMMQFHDMPTQSNDDNGEFFIDAAAFEFLLNQNKDTVVDSGKESLFLKFDPLFAKRMSTVTSDLNKIPKRQSTPTKAPIRSPQKEFTSPIAGPSNLNVTQDMDMNISEEFADDLNITVAKPMMVVPPAVNPVTPRNKSLTPNRSNRRSITFTSPAMAVIDRLLSLSGNSSLLHDTTVTQASREQSETDLALTQLRELLAEKEIHVYTLRNETKELKDRLCSMESHLKSLENESQQRLKNINDLNVKLAEKVNINKNMARVVEEYERTIASLISETALDKKRNAEERLKLINERDEQTAHLASMEVSFNDLHSKYEKSKQVILNCKANEEIYKKSIKEFEDNFTKMQSNYERLKQHATTKLNQANQELEKMNKSHEAEVLKLNAMVKRKELHITSLEETLAQRTKANEELTAICDELINKVG